MIDPDSMEPSFESSENNPRKKAGIIRARVVFLIIFIALIALSGTTWMCWDLIKAWASQLLIQPLPGKG